MNVDLSIPRFRSYDKVFEKEVSILRDDAIDTAYLAVELYGLGDRRLAIKLINEAVSIAKSYLSLALEFNSTDKINDANELVYCLEAIKEFMESREDPGIVKEMLSYT